MRPLLGAMRTSGKRRLRYQQPDTTTDYKCTGPFDLSSSLGLWVHSFNGLDPKGTITVKHTLHGGTYPAGGGAQDRVTVNYQYQP
ncbi:hypothetical protein [Streptosporangium sp. NPDC002607]